MLFDLHAERKLHFFMITASIHLGHQVDKRFFNYSGSRAAKVSSL